MKSREVVRRKMAFVPCGNAEVEEKEVIIISSDGDSQDDSESDDTESTYNSPQRKIVKQEPEVENHE